MAGKPPSGHVVGACGDLRRLEHAEPVQLAVALELDTEAAAVPRPKPSEIEHALRAFWRHGGGGAR